MKIIILLSLFIGSLTSAAVDKISDRDCSGSYWWEYNDVLHATCKSNLNKNSQSCSGDWSNPDSLVITLNYEKQFSSENSQLDRYIVAKIATKNVEDQLIPYERQYSDSVKNGMLKTLIDGNVDPSKYGQEKIEQQAAVVGSGMAKATLMRQLMEPYCDKPIPNSKVDEFEVIKVVRLNDVEPYTEHLTYDGNYKLVGLDVLPQDRESNFSNTCEAHLKERKLVFQVWEQDDKNNPKDRKGKWRYDGLTYNIDGDPAIEKVEQLLTKYCRPSAWF